MNTPNHKNWAHHWKLKDNESLNFVVLADATATEIVHEFYNVGTNKKMTIECRDNCPFCAASIEFSNHDMTKMARQFRPKEYEILNVFISQDEANITDQSPIKLMRLPIKDFNKLEVEGLYSISRNGSKFEFELIADDKKFNTNAYDEIKADDYVHSDTDQAIRDQYAFILSSFRQ